MQTTIVGLMLCVVSLAAGAETVATCGASKGYGYYLPKGGIPADEAGWTEDTISSGTFQLIKAGEEWDIIITNTRGGTFSARADGAHVVGHMTKDGDVVVHLLYERLTETYVFWLSLKEPVATFSQAKHSTPVPKHSVLLSKCRRGAK